MAKHITKRDLVIHVSNETGIVQQQVLNVVQQTLDYIIDSVSRGETVELRNFGVFEVKLRKARVGRNPNYPQTDVPIPPRAVVKFKPGKEMREAVVHVAENTVNGEEEQIVDSRTPVENRISADVFRNGVPSTNLRLTA